MIPNVQVFTNIYLLIKSLKMFSAHSVGGGRRLPSNGIVVDIDEGGYYTGR